MRHIMLLLALWPLASAAVAQDGARYRTPTGALGHAATKAVASAAVTAGARLVGVGRPEALLLGGIALWAGAKGLELMKGHRLGPWDTAHDLGWHLLGAVPVAYGRRRTALVSVAGLGLSVTLLRCKAAPAWGCG